MQFRDDHFEIGILGSNGLLGSDLVKHLGKTHKTDSITRENYEEKKNTHYKVLINANGNSKRFWANQNPQDDFLASTVSVYKSVFDFSSDVYIYISSPDVYTNHTHPQYTKEDATINPEELSSYGFHKYLAELIVKKYKEKFVVLRCAMILGTHVKKGPFHDIVNGKPLFINQQSKIQLITTRAVAEIIEIILQNGLTATTLNIGGEGTFAFTKIAKYFNQDIQIQPSAETQIYETNVTEIKKLYKNLKTSEEYLEDFVKSYLDKNAF